MHAHIQTSTHLHGSLFVILINRSNCTMWIFIYHFGASAAQSELGSVQKYFATLTLLQDLQSAVPYAPQKHAPAFYLDAACGSTLRVPAKNIMSHVAASHWSTPCSVPNKLKTGSAQCKEIVCYLKLFLGHVFCNTLHLRDSLPCFHSSNATCTEMAAIQAII